MGQMTIPKHQKGTNISKYQLSMIATQYKISWTKRLMMTTRLTERALAAHQSQMNKKCMEMMRILIYGFMQAIENLPLL